MTKELQHLEAIRAAHQALLKVVAAAKAAMPHDAGDLDDYAATIDDAWADHLHGVWAEYDAEAAAIDGNAGRDPARSPMVRGRDF